MLLLATFAAACAPAAGGAWRDQWVFAGDGGTVLALGLTRQTPGDAEAKGWLGSGGRWRSKFYDRFPILPREGPDAAATLGRCPSIRARLETDGAGVRLRIRTRSSTLALHAARLRLLGDLRDPGGSSRWRFGRATLRGASGIEGGWLLAERTRDPPRRPFVEYGDFVLVAAARPDGDLLVAIRSTLRGFDQAIRRRGGVAARTRGFDVHREDGALRLSVDAQPRAPLPILDRDVTSGTAPSGQAVRYETLLLGAAGPDDLRGVAFTIRPARGR